MTEDEINARLEADTSERIMSTVTTVTATCVEWPRERVESALARLDCSSWVDLVESAIHDGWQIVSLPDLQLTLCRVAAQHHREAAFMPWVAEVTHAGRADDVNTAAYAAAAYASASSANAAVYAAAAAAVVDFAVADGAAKLLSSLARRLDAAGGVE